MGIAISAQYSIAKLYNDPLIKTSTSLVAGKKGKALSASVSTAILTAIVIGVMQCLVFLLFSEQIISIMGVPLLSPMRSPALRYLKWRAAGTPAATVLLVSIGIFRGRGDTKTPLFCTALGNLINIVLDPILIFGCNMGCAGAGCATAISQWVTIFPLVPYIFFSSKCRYKSIESFFNT
jgi:putative MATE family efflux protein